MPSLTESLYAVSIVAGNLLAGTAMYVAESILFAGPLFILGIIVGAAYCLSAAMSFRSSHPESTRYSD